MTPGRASCRDTTLAAIPPGVPKAAYASDDSRTAVGLAARTGIPLPSVYRHLLELMELGLLQRRSGRLAYCATKPRPVWLYYAVEQGQEVP